MNFYDADLFFEASNFANNLAQKVADYRNRDIRTINCYTIQKYVSEVEDVEFIKVEFKRQLNRLMLGAITNVYGEVMITLNSSIMLERRNFTSMHETAHYYFDLPDIKDGQSLSDMVSQDSYYPEDRYREMRANIAAGILMANDEALKYGIGKFKTLDKTAEYFFMSRAALMTRISQYLTYVLNYTPEAAFSLINNYRYSDGKKFKEAFFNTK